MLTGDFTIESKVHPLGFYKVEFGSTPPDGIIVADECEAVQGKLPHTNFPLVAEEATKTPETSLKLVDVMSDQSIGKSQPVNVVGGGSIQDIAGFACAVYKRGIPWVYYPTTLLSQADSCIGAKVGLNSHAKNVVALFSAPTRVVIDVGYLQTLSDEAILCGLGEIFRLCVTGGTDYLSKFEELIAYAVARDSHALERLIRCALTVKKAVVEADEMEVDARRAMNLGHSIGHAIEAHTSYAIPHGIAITLGILVEAKLYGLKDADYSRLLKCAKNIVRKEDVEKLPSSEGMLHLLKMDKKASGDKITLIALEKIGSIRFTDMPLDEGTETSISTAISKVSDDLCQLF